MGALTGRPTGEQLTEWLARHRAAGLDQFMIYARSGLELEYLGTDWFEACRCLIEQAARHGMAIWIYDELNWPSGGAGGRVLAADPDFAARKLLVYREQPDDVAAEPVAGGRAYCRTARVTGSHAHDVLNPEAVDCFIRLTHEQYARHFAGYFGGTIKGFFTDEPSFAYGDAAHGDPRVVCQLAWYPELEAEYHGLTGRDLRRDLADHVHGCPPRELWSTYAQLLGRRFRFAFTDRLSRWCRRHGLVSSGHLTNEFSPRTAIAYSGDPVAVTRSFTLPGIDEIFSHATLEEAEWPTLKTVEQAAVRLGTGAMAELFALGPCDLSMTRRRQMIWLAALHGVDHYLMAVSSLDARANAIKQDYYHPFTPDEPWFEGVRELGDEAVRAAEYARKKGVYAVAVRFPQTLVAGQSAAGRTAIDDVLSELLRALVSAQWPALLVAETDTGLDGCEAVLALRADGFVEERSGVFFPDSGALLAGLEDRLRRPAEVLEACGNRAAGLLVKTFTDGSAAVLSLGLQDSGDLLLRIGDEAVPFRLPARGVFTLPAPPAGAAGGDVILPTTGWDYELDRPNTLRLVFDDDGVSEFEVQEDLRDIRLVTRLPSGASAVELDGRAIETGQPCHSLPGGFRPLYAESGALMLPRGRHTVRVVPPIEDFAYLPAAFLTGALARRGEGLIGALPAKLDLPACFEAELRGYVGTVAFRTRLDCADAARVHLEGVDLVSELEINGQPLGRRLWSPFLWVIPENGRQAGAAVTLRVATSIGPLFGEAPAAFRRRYAGNHWFNPLRYWPGQDSARRPA